MRIFISLGVLLVGLTLALPAQAGDRILKMPVSEAEAQPEADHELRNVEFYWGDADHPAIAEDMGMRSTSQRTRAMGREEDEACHWVWLSAMKRLHSTAVRLGADAVVEIESYYNENPYRSESEYECAMGRAMAGVALRGRFVTFE